MTKELFGNAFKDACRAARVHKKKKKNIYPRGEQRGYCGPTERDLWMDQKQDGFAIYRRTLIERSWRAMLLVSW